MSTALLVLAVLAAALICPGMMWWQQRRGRAAAGRVPIRGEEDVAPTETQDLAELRRRQAVLTARLDALRDGATISSGEGAARAGGDG